MWTVMQFQTIIDLQKYLNTGNGGVAFAAAAIYTIYFDGVSGRHIVVLAP